VIRQAQSTLLSLAAGCVPAWGAAAEQASPSAGGGADFSWWRAAGGTLAVFALLVICLQLLRRLGRAARHGEAALLAVWPLGPHREIQVLRLRDRVHYLYRHEGALVALAEEPLEAYRAASAAARSAAAGDAGAGLWRRWRDRLLPVAAGGGHPTR
jgi:hypothetical protein